MEEMKLAVVESKFADIIWNNEPIKSRELAKLCEAKLEWKRTTTYTVLKKLCNRGIFKNENGVVSSVISRDDFYGLQGEQLVDEAFDGSLPAFIAAFTKRKSLSDQDIADIQKMIDEAKEEKDGSYFS